jgi:hypothetical protein
MTLGFAELNIAKGRFAASYSDSRKSGVFGLFSSVLKPVMMMVEFLIKAVKVVFLDTLRCGA